MLSVNITTLRVDERSYGWMAMLLFL